MPNGDAYNASIESCRQDQFKQLEGTYVTPRSRDGAQTDTCISGVESKVFRAVSCTCSVA